MSITPEDFDYVRALLRERSAIVLMEGKEYLVEARLSILARQLGVSSFGELIAQLRASPKEALARRVVDALTTNETTFFRDVHPFEALKAQVMPDLLARRSTERRLTVWCAASSSGQEPYSIAIVMRENFPVLAGWKVTLLATDLSEPMLAQACAGVYSQLEVGRGLPADLLHKYLEKSGVGWRIKEEIRRMVTFRKLNLAAPWPALPCMDIIFIRNVMIYFDSDTKKDIFRRIRQILKTDGYLFLGGAETPLYLDDSFERVRLDKAACYRLREGADALARARA